MNKLPLGHDDLLAGFDAVRDHLDEIAIHGYAGLDLAEARAFCRSRTTQTRAFSPS